MNAVPQVLRLPLAFAFTVAVAYAACTMLFWMFPGAAGAFMNGLFHGLDFRRLQGAAGFTFGAFALALAGIAGWAFLMALVFGWIRTRV